MGKYEAASMMQHLLQSEETRDRANAMMRKIAMRCCNDEVVVSERRCEGYSRWGDTKDSEAVMMLWSFQSEKTRAKR